MVGALGAMKSARQWLNWSAGFSICWRRKWNVVSTCARGVVGVELDVVADGVGREEAIDAARGQQVPADDFVAAAPGHPRTASCASGFSRIAG